MSDIREALKKVPTPLGGLALGTASLGAAWSLIPQTPGWTLPVLCGVAGVALLTLWLKLLLLPSVRRAELLHPVIGSVMPTICMGTMIVASFLLQFFPALAKPLWLAAIVMHTLFASRFLYNQLRSFDVQKLVPSWFVPPIGIVVAAVTSRGMGFDVLAQSVVWIGLGFFALALPVVIYRLIFVERADTAAWPTMAIIGAPASLCLAGYLTAFSSYNPYVLLVLTPLAIIMTLFTYVLLMRLLLLPFSPGYAAFTFPLVIGATALLKLEQVIAGKVGEPVLNIVHFFAHLELYVATAVVSYVAIRYFNHYVFRPLLSRTDAQERQLDRA